MSAYNFLEYTYYLPLLLPTIRLLHFLKAKKLSVSFADGLAAGGIAYGLCYVILKFNAEYYFIPSTFILFFAAFQYIAAYSQRLYKKYPLELQRGIIFKSKCISLGICITLFAGWQMVNLNNFYNYATISTHSTSQSLEFWKICAQNKLKLLFWIPEQEDANSYVRKRREHFANMIPVFYNLYAKRPIDIAEYERLFYDELLISPPNSTPPFAAIGNFNDFLNQKSILMIMDWPNADTPWLLEKEHFLRIRTGVCWTLIKYEDWEKIKAMTDIPHSQLR